MLLVIHHIQISNQLQTKNSKSMVPAKARQKDESSCESFIEWKTKHNADSFSENTVAYFAELSKNYKSSTLWLIYLMLRSRIITKHDINITNN